MSLLNQLNVLASSVSLFILISLRYLICRHDQSSKFADSPSVGPIKTVLAEEIKRKKEKKKRKNKNEHR
jgi:hypothetical protein